MAYKYSVKANWGKNANGDSFIRHEDRKMFYIEGFPGDVWVVDDNIFGDQWITKVVGTTKTKAEAQAIVDGEIEDAQDAWDNNNVDGESSDDKIQRLGAKPVKYNLP